MKGIYLLLISLPIIFLFATLVSAIANPASVYCNQQGGINVIKTDPDGSQYGICRFGSQEFDEWNFYNNNYICKRNYVLFIPWNYKCAPTATPPITPSGTCMWCGLNCIKKEPNQQIMCIMIAPPEGKECVEENGQCVIRNKSMECPPIPISCWCPSPDGSKCRGYDAEGKCLVLCPQIKDENGCTKWGVCPNETGDCRETGCPEGQQCITTPCEVVPMMCQPRIILGFIPLGTSCVKPYPCVNKFTCQPISATTTTISPTKCQIDKDCWDTMKSCYWRCNEGVCNQIYTVVALKPYPDCEGNLCPMYAPCQYGTVENCQPRTDANGCSIPCQCKPPPCIDVSILSNKYCVPEYVAKWFAGIAGRYKTD